MAFVILTSISHLNGVRGHPTKKYEEGLPRHPEEHEQWSRSERSMGVGQVLSEQGVKHVVDMVPRKGSCRRQILWETLIIRK